MPGDFDLNRRSALKVLGSAGAAAAASGLGVVSLSGSSAAANVSISAGNPAQVKNDRGDIAEVNIDPKFRVEWNDFDQAVGKVFYAIEAKVGNGNYYPIFRSTPFLTGASTSGRVRNTVAGTTGHLEFVNPLSDVLSAAIKSRDDPERPSPDNDDNGAEVDDWPQLPRNRPLVVASQVGRPDYSLIGDSGGITKTTYLSGFSMGGADSEKADMLMKEAKDGNTPDIVNNYPGALSGYYGAADDTEALDNDTDGSGQSTTVSLRYTFAFYSVNESMRSYTDETNVREEDVEQASNGDSVLVMNGEDGYPTMPGTGNHGGASNRYDNLQTIASDHPAVIVETTSFDVTAINEQADSGVTGSSNPGASGGGQ
jgi:hypothetical protein